MKHATKRWGRGALAFLLSASMMTGGVPAQAFAEAIPPQGEVEVEPAGNENTTPAPQNTTSPKIVVQESDEPASEPAITTQADDVNSSYAAIVGDKNYAGIDEAVTELFSNPETQDKTLTLLKDVTMHASKTMDLRYDGFVCGRYIDLNGHTITFTGSDDYAIHVKDGHLGILDSSKTGSSAGTGTIAGAGVLVGAPPYEIYDRRPSLTMDCGTIKDAKEYGVDVRTLGTFTMEDGTITGSKASGVRVVGRVDMYEEGYFTSTFTMNGGTITGSTQNGVSVSDGATFTQKGGTITGNKGTKSQSAGGQEQLVVGNGVSVENATFTQEGGIVDQNAADGIHAGADSTITQGASGVIADNGRYGVFVDGGDNTTSSSVSIGGTVKGNARTGVYTVGHNNDYRVGTTIEGAKIIDNGKGVPDGENPDQLIYPAKGGGVYAGTYANLNLTNSTVSGNKAQNGAGVYVETVSIANVEGTQYTPLTISDNQIGGGPVEKAEPAVEGQDGADQAEETEETEKLTGNAATGNGGGVYIESRDTDDRFTISDNTISGNEAANGAGVYVKTAGREDAKARTIANNNIGAPIKTSQESTEGQGTTGQTEGTEETEEPAGNIATGNGGGVYIESSDATDRLSVDGNTISGNEAANGAGVYVKGAKQNDLISTITLSENTIAQNTAQAPAPEGDATTQDDSQTTPTGGDGGGLYMDTFSVLLNDESSSDIKENKATDGAGVYVASGQISITATASVTKNEATGNGGGFYVAGSNESGQDIAEGAVIGEKATVTDNSAANGGGIFIASGTAKVMCNITGNTASEQGGGVHHASESGVFAVAGKANVTGNEIKAAKSEEIVTQSDEAAEEKTFNNVFLGKKEGGGVNVITVTGQLDINSDIFVTVDPLLPTKETPADVQITTGYATSYGQSVPESPEEHFRSDAKHKDVYVGWYGSEENEAALKLHVHDDKTPWNYAERAVEGSKRGERVVDAWCISEEADKQEACSIHQADPLTLKISAKDATYDGKEYNAEKSEVTVEATYQDKAFDAWGLEKGSEIGLSVPVVEYYQGETKLDAAPKDAGTYTAKAVITQKLQSSSTETRTFSATCDFTIAPAPLTVTAKDKTVNFGDAPANDGVNYDGLVGGETEAVLSGTLAYDYAGYKAGSPAGSYKITPSGLTSNNYVITFKPGTLTVNGPKEVTTTYSAHVQGIGDTDPVHNGAESGTTGSSKRVESIKASIENQPYAGDIEYRGHVQGIGWEASWAKNGELSGTTGQSKRVEAIQMRLTGDMGKNYDVFYRVHAQTFGWLGWAKNGEPAGTSAMSKRVEAYEVLVLKKGETPEGYDAASAAFVSTPAGRAHVQGLGWVGRTGTSFGTTGSSRRVEAFTLGLSGLPWDGKISYQSHVQGIGWQGTKSDGALSGTTGKSKRVEAVRISLSGEASEHLDVWYRVHSQTYGWLGWAKNGESAGTAGYSKRSEAVEVQLLPKGATPAGYDASKTAYRTK